MNNTVGDFCAIFKSAFSIALAFLIWANHHLDPTEYVQVADGGSADGIQAAMYALIAALAFLATSIPLGQNHRYNNWILAFGNGVGGVAAFLAGWYWLESEIEGSPGPYAYPLFGFGALMILFMVGRAFLPERTKRE